MFNNASYSHHNVYCILPMSHFLRDLPYYVIHADESHCQNFNMQNVDGHTALMFAYNGKNQVEVLLDKYSEYMKESNDNSTRIIKEALQTHVEVVQLLIKGGADLTIKDSEGHVAVDFDYKAPTAITDTPAVAAPEGAIMPDKEL